MLPASVLSGGLSDSIKKERGNLMALSIIPTCPFPPKYQVHCNKCGWYSVGAHTIDDAKERGRGHHDVNPLHTQFKVLAYQPATWLVDELKIAIDQPWPERRDFS